MKKLIDVPTKLIPSAKKIAKKNKQSVKAYLEMSVVAAILSDQTKL